MFVSPGPINTIGSQLNRPECVLAHGSGYLFTSDWSGQGGVSVIAPNGDTHRILADYPSRIKPNGIALRQNGTFLLAHLGDDKGGVFEMDHMGNTTPFMTELNGQVLPPTNFVVEDVEDRSWITVSTRQIPRAAAYRYDVSDGFILMQQGGTTRIAADGLGYTNECLLSQDGSTLFVNETFGRRLSAYSVNRNHTLGPRRTVAVFGAGTFPDGLCQDEDGNLWITSIVSNRVIKVTLGGEIQTLIEDVDPEHVDIVESAYQEHSMGRPHLDQVRSSTLRNISSLAFGGADRRTGYLGCLLGESIYSVSLPETGARPFHWDADISRIAQSVS